MGVGGGGKAGPLVASQITFIQLSIIKEIIYLYILLLSRDVHYKENKATIFSLESF